MDSENDNEEVFYCDVREFRVYCNICDKLCREQFYKSHFISQTHTNNNRMGD